MCVTGAFEWCLSGRDLRIVSHPPAIMRGMRSDHELAEARLPRRKGLRAYSIERPLPREGPRPTPEPGDPAIAAAELLAAAGSLLSSLRKPMREAGLDLPLARLLLTFPPNRAPLRIARSRGGSA